MIPATEPETTVVFDTPAGLIKSYARVEENQVVEVSVANVSSFLYARDVELDLPDVRIRCEPTIILTHFSHEALTVANPE